MREEDTDSVGKSCLRMRGNLGGRGVLGRKREAVYLGWGMVKPKSTNHTFSGD